MAYSERHTIGVHPHDILGDNHYVDTDVTTGLIQVDGPRLEARGNQVEEGTSDTTDTYFEVMPVPDRREIAVSEYERAVLAEAKNVLKEKSVIASHFFNRLKASPIGKAAATLLLASKLFGYSIPDAHSYQSGTQTEATDVQQQLPTLESVNTEIRAQLQEIFPDRQTYTSVLEVPANRHHAPDYHVYIDTHTPDVRSAASAVWDALQHTTGTVKVDITGFASAEGATDPNLRLSGETATITAQELLQTLDATYHIKPQDRERLQWDVVSGGERYRIGTTEYASEDQFRSALRESLGGISDTRLEQLIRRYNDGQLRDSAQVQLFDAAFASQRGATISISGERLLAAAAPIQQEKSIVAPDSQLQQTSLQSDIPLETPPTFFSRIKNFLSRKKTIRISNQKAVEPKKNPNFFSPSDMDVYEPSEEPYTIPFDAISHTMSPSKPKENAPSIPTRSPDTVPSPIPFRDPYPSALPSIDDTDDWEIGLKKLRDIQTSSISQIIEKPTVVDSPIIEVDPPIDDIEETSFPRQTSVELQKTRANRRIRDTEQRHESQVTRSRRSPKVTYDEYGEIDVAAISPRTASPGGAPRARTERGDPEYMKTRRTKKQSAEQRRQKLLTDMSDDDMLTEFADKQTVRLQKKDRRAKDTTPPEKKAA